jgi:hypothetical protein
MRAFLILLICLSVFVAVNHVMGSSSNFGLKAPAEVEVVSGARQTRPRPHRVSFLPRRLPNRAGWV